MVYPGGPGTKITSVSTGNLCADVSDHCGVISGVCVLNAAAGQLTLRWREESPARCPSRRDAELFLWSGDIQTGCRRLLFWKAFNEPFRFKAAVSAFLFIYFYFFCTARTSPRLPVQRLTPSPPRRTPGITSPYQLQRVRTAWSAPGRGPLSTGREWRTESASPWSTTSTTACR